VEVRGRDSLLEILAFRFRVSLLFASICFTIAVPLLIPIVTFLFFFFSHMIQCSLQFPYLPMSTLLSASICFTMALPLFIPPSSFFVFFFVYSPLYFSGSVQFPYLATSTLLFASICFTMSGIATQSASSFFLFWFIFLLYASCITFFGLTMAVLNAQRRGKQIITLYSTVQTVLKPVHRHYDPTRQHPKFLDLGLLAKPQHSTVVLYHTQYLVLPPLLPVSRADGTVISRPVLHAPEYSGASGTSHPGFYRDV